MTAPQPTSPDAPDPPSAPDPRAEHAGQALLLIAAGVLVTIALLRAPALTRRDAPGDGAVTTAGLRLDPNTATVPQLELLPRVGPVLAQRIVEHRETRAPFERPADLDLVRGIGPRTLELLAPYLDFPDDPEHGG